MVGKGVKVGTDVEIAVGVLEGKGVTVAVKVGVTEGEDVTVAVGVGVAVGDGVSDGKTTVAVDATSMAEFALSFFGPSDCGTVQPTRITIVKSNPVISQ
jgi:hypothetical protein